MRTLLATGVFLALVACIPAAAPGAEDNTGGSSSPTQMAAAASGEVTVIAVNQEVESEGITIGVTHVELTSGETLVSYWMDCGPHEALEPVGKHRLITDSSLELEHVGGGGGKVCDPSEIKQMRFGSLPAGVSSVTVLHGPSVGTTPGELVLELPIGSHLSGIDRFGGMLDLDMTVQADGLAYLFTTLGYGIDHFSLEYEPANEEARWRPLRGPGARMTLEDDLGNEFSGSAINSRFDGDLALRSSRLEFRGGISPNASVWTLRIQNPGKIYRGPWEIEIPIPSGAPLASASPTATATPEPAPADAAGPVFPPRPTPAPGVEPSRFEEALAMAPLELGSGLVLFADYDGSRVATDLEELRGPDFPSRIASDNLSRLYEGVPLPEAMRNYSHNLKERIDLNILGMDTGIWAMTPPWGEEDFLVMKGVFDSESIAARLADMDYKQAEHKGVPYYWLNEEVRADIRHPLRHLSLQLNRVALVEDRFLAAPTTSAIERLIEVQEADNGSLLDSRPHRALDEAAGHGLLGAAIMTPEWVVEDWNTRNTGPIARLERYEEGPDRWGELSPYSLALLGYRLRGDSEETVLAFFYPDAAAAERDAEEVEKRWNSFHYDHTGSREQEVPATASCSQFSAEAIAGPDYSVLVGICEVIRSVERDPAVKGPDLWKWLLDTRELQFLAPDLSELKAVHQDENQ